jgi:hypothetical protein
MTTNVANFDRAARAWLGMMILATPLLELNSYPYSLIGLIPLVTGLAGYCPLYRLFGRRSVTPTGSVLAMPPGQTERVRQAA